MAKTALITGITGQDGFYLAQLLLAKNYRVVGIKRKNTQVENTPLHIFKDKIHFIDADLKDSENILKAIESSQPDELYNLASQSYPRESWSLALETATTNGLGAHRLFDAIHKIKPCCKIYQASSSEMFGDVSDFLQNENTPFNPNNPYAAAKVYAHNIAKIYRKSYKLFISCGILFNHESPYRGIHFISQKITYAAACIKLGIHNSPLFNENKEPIVKDNILSLGNLDAKRDWGFAGDYVEAMWLMLQQDQPDDFVIGTGITRSIRELCEAAFSYVGLDWQNHIVVDPRLIRPVDTGTTLADSTKAKKILGWEPKTSFDDFIKNMIDVHINNLSSPHNASTIDLL